MRGEEQKFTKVGFVRTYVMPALLLFAIPAAGYGFGRQANGDFDKRFVDAVAKSLDGNHDVTASRRAEILRFYRTNPPSRLCAAGARGRKFLPADRARRQKGRGGADGRLPTAAPS